jgi:hypothetical protein
VTERCTEQNPGSCTRLNAMAPKVPRRSRAMLGVRERWRAVTVLGPVTGAPVLLRPRTRDTEAVFTTHRTVRVHVDGEEEPRRIDFRRLTEFSRESE